MSFLRCSVGVGAGKCYTAATVPATRIAMHPLPFGLSALTMGLISCSCCLPSLDIISI